MAEISKGRVDTSDSVHGTFYWPQPIFQKIISHLPLRVATQMSILSKDWNHAFISLSALEFDEETFGSKDVGSHNANIDTFLEYVDGYITRRRKNDLGIDSVSLLVFSRGNKLNSMMPKWIDIASRLNLRDLTLGRIVDYPDRRYNQKCPDLASNTISVLHVSHLSMQGIKMKLSRLEELVVHKAHESDDIFNELMLSCRTLRLVQLIGCSRSRDLLICGSKLETFEASAVLHNDSFSISISAPNLVSFSYTSIFVMDFPDGQLSNLQVHGARNLRELALDLCVLSIKTIKEVISRLRLLETLRLKGSRSAKRIRITHKNLNHLALTEFDSLIRVKTQTPNLVSFQYNGPSTRLANARLEVDFRVNNKRRSYLKAAKFLRYFGYCDSLTLVCNEIEALVLPKEIISEVLPPLWNVKHLRTQILCNTFGDIDTSSQLAESLRWMCPNLEMLAVSSKPSHKQMLPTIASGPRGDKYSRVTRKKGGLEH